MKTTIEVSYALMRRAKLLAARRGITLRVLIEDALRATLDADAQARARAPVETHTFGGRGLQPGLSWGDWGAIRARADDGHGG